jgi:hypothetical protein
MDHNKIRHWGILKQVFCLYKSPTNKLLSLMAIPFNILLVSASENPLKL